MNIIITPPHDLPGENYIVNELFNNGLHRLHLRKPGADRGTVEGYIRQVAPRFRDRIVLHDHFDLVEAYGLRGIHLSTQQAATFTERARYAHVSVSCHSLEEIEGLPFQPEYVFLSPVFDSISKPGYKAAFDTDLLREGLKRTSTPVIALGGITDENALVCRQLGFAGVALLGYLWNERGEALERFSRVFPAPALSIAGFDPTAGAGVTADIKTFETCGTYGLGVTSGITFQNQNEYLGTKWMTPDEIIRQCDVLFREFHPSHVKIGLIESFDALEQVITYLATTHPRVKITWDPILKASAGGSFHATEDTGKLRDILKHVYLLTPNTDELTTLFGEHPDMEKLQEICREDRVNILWKGGHNDGNLVTDRLITGEGIHAFSVARAPHGKHGTGCVLSSAITSYLTHGYSLPKACRLGQRYVSHFIRSNATLLGLHRAFKEETMPVDISDIRLQYITDHREGISIPEQVEAVCRGGCRWVQLRMKGAPREEILRVGKIVKEICHRHKALFIVNDHVDIALELDADGVHLGKEDMNPLEAREILGYSKIIGATCNTFKDVKERDRQGVDYIGLGPFAHTTTKEHLDPVLGFEGYDRIMQAGIKACIDIPTYAIGGIRENDIPAILGSDDSGIALSSLLNNSRNMEAKTREIIKIIQRN